MCSGAADRRHLRTGRIVVGSTCRRQSRGAPLMVTLAAASHAKMPTARTH